MDLNLARIERRSWRTQQQDGLLDLFLGVAILALGLAALAEELGGGVAARLATLSGIQFSAAFMMWWARRHWTRPRIGAVKFSLPRRRRINRMRAILGACVAVTAVLVLLTAWANRVRPELLGNLGALTAAVASAAVVLLPLGTMAILLDLPRLWLHAVLLAAVLAASVSVVDPPIAFFETILFGAAGVLSLSVGLLVFARFVRSVRRGGEMLDRSGGHCGYRSE